MKTKTNNTKAALAATVLILGCAGMAQAEEADPSTNTVAYWKFGGTSQVVESISGVGILDLATNVGQGSLNGSAASQGVLASVDNLEAIGPVVTFPTDVPPSGMFNSGFNAGTASWDCGVDSANGTEVYADPTVSGNEWIPANYTEECFFKTDYTNDPTLGTVKQTLFWNHQTSAYGELQLNESAAFNTNDIGSLLFWGWNVVTFPTVRITAAQNGGHRFDDGQWHYVACRWNSATLIMDLFVVNQDGTTAESSSYLGAALNPGNPAGGNFIVGNDESGNFPFQGKINQARFSQAVLPNSLLLANAPGCVSPVFENSAATNSVNVGASLTLSPLYQPLNMEGGPLLFQWQLNGAKLTGQTNAVLTIYPVTSARAGAYTLTASIPCGGSVTSAPMVVVAEPAVTLARWGFNFTEAQTFPQATVDDLAPAFPNAYDLITFNNQPNLSGIGGNGEIPLTNSVPPATMLINGNNAGTNAFDPSYLAGQDGVVFYPAGPDVFDFQTSFSLELFFRTYGNQSGAGTMELICQGTDGGNTFRYGVNVNQAGPGVLSFGINNYSIAATGPTYEDFNNPAVQTVSLANANYADGNWHYLLAQYDSIGNTISLSVANQDNTGTNAVVALPSGYGPLPNYSEGNLFVGRYRYPWSDDNRNFFGSIDEVQVSAGLVTPSLGQLGYLPTPPRITGISASAGSVTISFTGAPTALANSYSIVASPAITSSYATVSATVTSLGGGNFQAVVPKNGAAEFYKIKH